MKSVHGAFEPLHIYNGKNDTGDGLLHGTFWSMHISIRQKDIFF